MAYALHENVPNDKARLHIVEGCHWVRKALANLATGGDYGPVRGDDNGSWTVFDTLPAAEAAQACSRRGTQDYCRAVGCREHFER